MIKQRPPLKRSRFNNIYVIFRIYTNRNIYIENTIRNINMAKPSRTFDIDIVDEGGSFTTFFKRITGEHSGYDFQGVSALRHLLSNEKAKVLHLVKIKKPNSIYQLAKMLKRDFKSVNDDVKLLEKFGLIDLISERTGKRERLKPVLVADSIHINFRF